MLHIPQIKKTLGIDRIHTEYYSWRSRESMPAAQIDLIIDRADNLTNVCEIKYSQLPAPPHLIPLPEVLSQTKWKLY